MWNAITQIITNVGMSFENIVVLINTLGSLIFCAKDFKLGMVILFVTSGGLFVWFYETGLEYVTPLVLFFMSLIIMILTLYAMNKETRGGLV